MLEQDAQIPEASNTTEAPEQGAPETKPEGQGEQNEEHKPRSNGLQKRIDKLTREKYELKGRLQALESRVAQPQPATSQEPNEDDEKPMTRREALELAERMARQQQAAQSQEATAREWKKQEAEAKKMYEDYDDVVPDFIEDWNPPRHVEAAILECERKVAVTYYLAKHREEADAIAAMSPFRAAAEIGKIEARLESPTPKKQSAAPEPIAPLRPKGKADDGLGDDLSIDEWTKRRNAQIRKNK